MSQLEERHRPWTKTGPSLLTFHAQLSCPQCYHDVGTELPLVYNRA
jgi:hypothetical protein